MTATLEQLYKYQLEKRTTPQPVNHQQWLIYIDATVEPVPDPNAKGKK